MQLGHELNDERRLEGTNISKLAELRLHTLNTAMRNYDARDKVKRAAKANRALLKSADRYYGLADEDDTDEETSHLAPAPAASPPAQNPSPEVSEPQAGPSGISRGPSVLTWGHLEEGEDTDEDTNPLTPAPAASPPMLYQNPEVSEPQPGPSGISTFKRPTLDGE